MNIALVTKSKAGVDLSLYDSDLVLIESESFADLYTLNFHLQTLARKYKIEKGLLVVHDKNNNAVDLSIARDENSFFLS
jgi:hypothetical protein